MRPDLTYSTLPAISVALALALIHTAPAHACGGMVFPEHSERVGGMSEQELFVAFTPDSTVLLASAGYKGATGSPAFILPLPAEPTMVSQAGTGVLLALDELSAPSVSISRASDNSGGGFCGGSLNDAGGLGNGGERGDGDIMVLQRGSTADYDYVVVGGDTGEDITAWLATAGYVLPADYGAALTPYVDSGNFIFAAKVKSSAADGALAPIELHLPPGDPAAFAIPFGLAAHSLPPGESLTITAYVLATGTVVPGNYGARAIDRAALVADSETESNYQALYDEAVAEAGGAWVVDASFGEFATTDLTRALDSAIAAGRADSADRPGVAAFADRVPLTGARLTRFRTTLGAEQLHDMTLTKATLDPVDPALGVIYDPDAGTSCSLGSRRSVPLGALLLPLLLLLRRRRR
ncbi:MAG: DUF2330 domain-containing protein [Nannocystis sp.]|nr:DUF2330 domain-containing protein [Nannocystis sp.]MBA3546639.1 DUF2330 domain-containing protein [Nannocystis sp.]